MAREGDKQRSGGKPSSGRPSSRSGGRSTGGSSSGSRSGGRSSQGPSKSQGRGKPAKPAKPGRKPDGRKGANSSGGTKDGRKKEYTATTRSVADKRMAESAKRRRDLRGSAVNLPNWVVEALVRVTPRDRVAPALEALGSASEALADGRYQAAVKHGNRAKALSPQDPTTRETIGIAAYRMGDWATALSELRAFRRMQGDITHLPVEMDVLRAQGRPRDVETSWEELRRRGAKGLVLNEGVIVYASFLLDEGRVDEAWALVDPGRPRPDPNEASLRRYYVAARVAAARGDRATAKRLSDAIVVADPSFPGYEELEAEIAAIPGT